MHKPYYGIIFIYRLILHKGATTLNIEKNLILIKGEDKTKDVEYCKYDTGISKWKVTFTNGKVYSYNYTNVLWFYKPIEIDIANKIIYANHEPLGGVSKVIYFEDYVKVIFKSKFTKVFSKYDIEIEESSLKDKVSSNCFTYLKELSDVVGIKMDNGSLLKRQYEKIEVVSPRSVLSFYLNPHKLKEMTFNRDLNYPFGFNLSQRKAVENAFTSNISIIEGPPGTGKTQTILNIIASIVMENKTVAVVSNNNTATDNILEKLKNHQLDFIAAPLGNDANKTRFIENQKGEYGDFTKWKLTHEEKVKISTELKEKKAAISSMMAKDNKLSQLKQELSELEIERQHFEKEYLSEDVASLKYNSIKKLKADKLMKFIIEIRAKGSDEKIVTFWFKINNLFKYGIINLKFYKNSIDEILDYLCSQYYNNKTIELKIEINKLQKELDRFDFEKEMDNYTSNSMKIFKDYLAGRYNKRKPPIFTKEDLWKKFNLVTTEYPVVLSSTHSLASTKSENFLFDYVIIDEASQVDIVAGALALSCAKNAVIVGDLKQLPNIVSKEDKEIIKDIYTKYNLHEAYDYCKNSLLSSISTINKTIKRTLLREHYRCHPQIINFCNKQFYNNELIIKSKGDGNLKPLAVYKTALGNHGRDKVNQRQIDVIREEILPKINSDKSIGIIAPYRDQVNEITKYIGVDTVAEVDTVHKFQGREKDVIILSTVSNKINDFNDDPNLVNVAVSRAVHNLMVVTSDFQEENSNLGDLIRYVSYNNLDIVESKISSVFDLLYKPYMKQLKKTLEKNKRISEFASEQLMFNLIEEVLALEEFSNLDVAVHFPLRMIIRDMDLLTLEERKFALHRCTHADFLIFNKLDKKPVLVVEVDGYKFHVQNEKQLERDRKKDGILSKYEIPIIRFATNGSGEKEKLVEKLKAVL